MLSELTFMNTFPPKPSSVQSLKSNLKCKLSTPESDEIDERKEDDDPATSQQTHKQVSKKAHGKRSKKRTAPGILTEAHVDRILGFKHTEDSDDEPPMQEITSCLFLEQTVIVTAARGRSVKASSTTSHTDSTQCPPFIFKEDVSFRSLLKLVAIAAETTTDHLAVTQLHWKFEIPAKGQRKLISNAIGLQTMMKAITEKKGNPVVFFYLLKPAPTAKSATAVMVDDELELEVAQDSMKSQISAIRKENAEFRCKLEEAHPLSNHLLFPGKRIYAGGNKQFWELTDIHLEVWANAIAKDRATIISPPTSTHFTAASTIKPRHPAADASREVLVAYAEYTGTQVPAAPVPSHEHAPMLFNQVAAPFNHILALHAQQASVLPPTMPPYPYRFPPFYPYGAFGLGPGFPQIQNHIEPAPKTPKPDNPPSAICSPGMMTHGVTLDVFCKRYNIPNADAQHLTNIGYIPGDNLVLQLVEAEWKAAGFALLGWMKIIHAHKEFRQVIKECVAVSDAE
ncbi:hypothetical protein BDN67DRAFT_1015479 [Paxillus ammoniavirescens]|nr:hypothetical protein BDN67DRAFT_1015479 [Paxillus ammoniavirescens]